MTPIGNAKLIMPQTRLVSQEEVKCLPAISECVEIPPMFCKVVERPKTWWEFYVRKLSMKREGFWKARISLAVPSGCRSLSFQAPTMRIWILQDQTSRTLFQVRDAQSTLKFYLVILLCDGMTANMTRSLGQQMARTAGIFQGLTALPAMTYLGWSCFEQIFYPYLRIYDFMWAAFTYHLVIHEEKYNVDLTLMEQHCIRQRFRSSRNHLYRPGSAEC